MKNYLLSFAPCPFHSIQFKIKLKLLQIWKKIINCSEDENFDDTKINFEYYKFLSHYLKLNFVYK